MKKRVFIKNAAILTVTAIILRSAGMLLRIYMSNVIGAEGMGLYQMIFSVYVLAATFAASGLSTAVTRLVTDELVKGNARSVKRVLRRSIEMTFAVGLLIASLVYIFADKIALYWICDLRAAPALKILTFSLVFMGVSSCFKGYFMARRKAIMPSGAQIFEQCVRIVSVVTMMNMFGKNGVEQACFALLFSDTIAEILSCLYLFICCSIDKRKIISAVNGGTTKGITKTLIKISAPIIAGRYLSTILRTVENLAVPNCLSGYSGSKSEALSQFGELKGMALPIIFFPSSFLMSMSTLLIPEMSEARAVSDTQSIKAQVSRAICITLQMSVLISAIFTVLSNEVGVIVYKSESVGFLIRVLAPLIPAMYLESVCDGMLKGLNQQNHSLVYGVIDSVFRIVCIFVLLPKFGMAGFLAMMVVSNLFTSVMNVARLLKIAKVRFDFMNWIFKPLVFCAISGVTACVIFSAMKPEKIIYCALIILFISVCYFSLLLVTNSSLPLKDAVNKIKNRKKA